MKTDSDETVSAVDDVVGEQQREDEVLEELEAEELEMLTEDEASETIVVDEIAELRAIRRAEVALGSSGEERADD